MNQRVSIFKRHAFLAFFILSLVIGAAAGCSAGEVTDCSTGFFAVTTTDDIGDGACTGSHCTLREAVNAANTCGSEGSEYGILLGRGTFTLTLRGPGDERGDLNILSNRNISIAGEDRGLTIIQGGDGWNDRIFEVAADAELSLRLLTVQGGNSSSLGGAILNNGTISISNVTLVGNTAAGNGGALFSSGEAVLRSVDVLRNNANSAGSGCGGGLYSSGRLTVWSSLIQGNNSNNGHGICSDTGGYLEIHESRIIDNGPREYSGYSLGGGIFTDGSDDTRISDTVIQNNRAAIGGGLYAGQSVRSLRLDRVTVSDNIARQGTGREGDPIYGLGGGVYMRVDNYAIVKSLIIDNSAEVHGGGLYLDTLGSAVKEIIGVAIARNSAQEGGGIYKISGFVRLINVTISSNQANFGAAILNTGTTESPIILVHVTISNNGAPAGATEHSAIFKEWGSASWFSFTNTLVVDNLSPACIGVPSSFRSLGYNYADFRGCNLIISTDLQLPEVTSFDIALDSLSFVDGTLVHILWPWSFAANYIPPSENCHPNDQLWTIRPQGDNCEIGAYEIGGGTMMSYQADIPDDTLCFFGPASQYGTVSSLAAGISVQLIGQGALEGWLIIDNPRFPGVACWLPEDDIDIPPDLDLGPLPLYEIPALPDVEPDPDDDPSDDSGPGSPNAPAAPGGLQSNTRCDSEYEVTLTWNDNSNNESGFRIYRDGSLIATVGANTTTYKDTNPTNSNGHNYSVRAYNSAGESAAVAVSSEGCLF